MTTTNNKKVVITLYSFEQLKNNKSNDFLAYTYAEDQLREVIMQLFVNESYYFADDKKQILHYNLTDLDRCGLDFKSFLSWVLPILTQKKEVLFSKLGTIMQVGGRLYDPKEAENFPIFDFDEVKELLTTFCKEKENKCA